MFPVSSPCRTSSLLLQCCFASDCYSTSSLFSPSCSPLFLPCSAQYRSLSLDQLCTMFEMDEKAVYSIVSKMMIAEDLHGSWDQPTRTIVMHSIEATKVQSLAGQFADKATVSGVQGVTGFRLRALNGL